jgi:hypothetical protein
MTAAKLLVGACEEKEGEAAGLFKEKGEWMWREGEERWVLRRQCSEGGREVRGPGVWGGVMREFMVANFLSQVRTLQRQPSRLEEERRRAKKVAVNAEMCAWAAFLFWRVGPGVRGNARWWRGDVR